MDTLQVCSTSSQYLNSNKLSSRGSSPCRSDQMSKDRDSGDSASGGGGGSGNSGFRFRNHSPSTTQRKSRERDRKELHRDQSQQQQQQQQQQLQQQSQQHQQLQQQQQQLTQQYRSGDRDIGDGGGGLGSGGTMLILGETDSTMDYLDDSKLSGAEELGYQSFMSDEVDAQHQQYLPQHQLVSNDGGSASGAGNSDSLKRFRHHHHRSNSGQALDRLSLKIACTKDSIRKEQTVRDDNVNEYLKLASNADKQQIQRIKAVFEKKNQKSAQTIAQLQKKLENYNKKVKELQIHQSQKHGGVSGISTGGINTDTGSGPSGTGGHRQPREVLRDVGQGLKHVGGNIRDGISGLSGSVMSKPREFAHLIKNKFGSADNINHLSSTWYTDPELNTINLTPHQMDIHLQQQQHQQQHGSSTPNNTIGPSGGGGGGSANNTLGGGGGGGGGGGSGKFSNENESECSSVTSDSMPPGSGKQPLLLHQYSTILKSILAELQERKEDCEKFKEKLERLENVQKEFQDLTAALEGERYRSERLEEQINDLTELHQTEIENLKQNICDMEEKVQYQSDERLRDVNEVMENCQTRISKMEHMSQQQYVTVEGIDNSNARALVVKLINVVLTILQVILLLVATAAGIIMPFLKTRLRVLTTFFFVFLAIFVIRQWPDVKDIGSHMVRNLKESLIVK